MATLILVAGSTGNLGGRIIKALLERGATVRALVRPGTDQQKLDKLTQPGVEIVAADPTDVAALTEACRGAACVVSAVQGLRDVIMDAQAALLAAAVAAGVPRFIPSDFASDYTKTREGDNRNFDLRREFNQHLDQQAGITGTSILNGAFAEVLMYNPQLLNKKEHKVGYVEDADWRVDYSTMDDTAAYTAAAALDATTPRYLRIASFQLSPRELAAVAGEATGAPYELTDLGRREALAAYNRQERAAHPEGEQEIYPRWQQSQYMHSMFSVQNNPLDNARYPDLTWTSARDVLAGR